MLRPMKINSILQPKRILHCLGAASCTTERQTLNRYSDRGATTVTRHEYVYYPTHNAYYNRRADNFRVYDGSKWMTLNTLPNVSRQVVLSSESMSIDQYDTPERHYTEYVQPNLMSGNRSVQRVTTSSRQVQ